MGCSASKQVNHKGVSRGPQAQVTNEITEKTMEIQASLDTKNKQTHLAENSFASSKEKGHRVEEQVGLSLESIHEPDTTLLVQPPACGNISHSLSEDKIVECSYEDNVSKDDKQGGADPEVCVSQCGTCPTGDATQEGPEKTEIYREVLEQVHLEKTKSTPSFDYELQKHEQFTQDIKSSSQVTAVDPVIPQEDEGSDMSPIIEARPVVTFASDEETNASDIVDDKIIIENQNAYRQNTTRKQECFNLLNRISNMKDLKLYTPRTPTKWPFAYCLSCPPNVLRGNTANNLAQISQDSLV